MKEKIKIVTFVTFVLFSLCMYSMGEEIDKQIEKNSFDVTIDVTVKNPLYQKGKGPVVMFDEGHFNHQTSTARYKGLVDIIVNDGYVVRVNKSRFTNRVLRDHDILIISNSLNEINAPWGEKGGPPFYSAFTSKEVEAVHKWVKKGGSLFLVADHFPFGTAAFDLAKRFGVIMDKGLTKSDNIFTRENGTLLDHPITLGRNESERVNVVRTFTGQSLQLPHESGFLRFSEEAYNVNHAFKEKKSVAGHYLGAAFAYGAGRVVILGEAGMLCAMKEETAKQKEKNSKGRIMVPQAGHYWGMKPEINDNKKLLINIIHYLSGIFEPGIEVKGE